MQDRFRSNPLICIVGLSPLIQLTNNSVYEVLFLARLEENSLAFVVKATENLLQPIHGVMSDVLA